MQLVTLRYEVQCKPDIVYNNGFMGWVGVFAATTLLAWRSYYLLEKKLSAVF